MTNTTALKLFIAQAPGTLFTTLHFLLNIHIGQISSSVTLRKAKKAFQ